MPPTHRWDADVTIIGAGLAGLAAAIDLLDSGRRVLVIDRDRREHLGGMAKDSFGGVTMFDTPYQRRMGIQDSLELGWRDWDSTAEFDESDHWPRLWARHYVEHSIPGIYEWLTSKGLRFFPVIHWVERGLFKPGNSVPRFHMVWGTGKGLVDIVTRALENHPKRDAIRFQYESRVDGILVENGAVVGCRGVTENEGPTGGSSADFEARSPVTIIASGGICGKIDLVKKHWHTPLGTPPETILNGSHRFADGRVLFSAESAARARVTHLDHQWNYAAGVHHPRPDPRKPGHGLSLVPPKSALWMNWEGRRMGPIPLVTSYDTKFQVERICQEPRKYSWQVLNRKIAVKELAVSGSEFNDAIRDRKILAFLKNVLFGNHALVDDLCQNCPDFVVAETIEELARKMNRLQGDDAVDPRVLREEIERYDSMIARGPAFYNDEQLRRIAQARLYRGDRVRTCKFQRILDPGAGPLIAIREFILSRKTLGGIQTDLESRALSSVDGNPILGLYAVGEAAGFGGGGLHGKGALEGTFLGGAILTGRAAARSIKGGK